MRRDRAAAVPPVAVVLLVVVLVVAGLAASGTFSAPKVSEEAGSGGEGDEGTSMGEDYDPSKEYVPTIEVELARNQAGLVYDADMYLAIEDVNFVRYFFHQLSFVDEGFPEGENELRFEIYTGHANARETLLTAKRFMIGELEDKESTWTIEFDKLRLSEETDPTVIYLWGYCYHHDAEIGKKVWVINPEGMGITGS